MRARDLPKGQTNLFVHPMYQQRVCSVCGKRPATESSRDRDGGYCAPCGVIQADLRLWVEHGISAPTRCENRQVTGCLHVARDGYGLCKQCFRRSASRKRR